MFIMSMIDCSNDMGCEYDHHSFRGVVPASWNPLLQHETVKDTCRTMHLPVLPQMSRHCFMACHSRRTLSPGPSLNQEPRTVAMSQSLHVALLSGQTVTLEARPKCDGSCCFKYARTSELEHV